MHLYCYPNVFLELWDTIQCACSLHTLKLTFEPVKFAQNIAATIEHDFISEAACFTQNPRWRHKVITFERSFMNDLTRTLNKRIENASLKPWGLRQCFSHVDYLSSSIVINPLWRFSSREFPLTFLMLFLKRPSRLSRTRTIPCQYYYFVK